jgi:hypothetical protein
MKPSLKSIVANGEKPQPTTTSEIVENRSPSPRSYRVAQTRMETRQVSGHYRPEVAQALRVIAAEQGKDVQEILAEGLNMVFTRYGKPTRAEVTSGRRKKVTT